MIKLLKHKNQLLLTYQPDRFNDARWLDDKLQKDCEVTLRRTFTFTPVDLVTKIATTNQSDDGERTFLLGTLQVGYYKINKEILGLKHDLMLAANIRFGTGTFIAQRDISVFRSIDKLVDQPIIVGGDHADAIPLTDFEFLLRISNHNRAHSLRQSSYCAGSQRLLWNDVGCRRQAKSVLKSKEETPFHIS